MIALIVLGSIFGYCVAGGAIWAALPEELCESEIDSQVARALCGVFWPLALPFALGIVSVRRAKLRLAARRERRLLPEARSVRR